MAANQKPLKKKAINWSNKSAGNQLIIVKDVVAQPEQSVAKDQAVEKHQEDSDQSIQRTLFHLQSTYIDKPSNLKKCAYKVNVGYRDEVHNSQAKCRSQGHRNKLP